MHILFKSFRTLINKCNYHNILGAHSLRFHIIDVVFLSEYSNGHHTQHVTKPLDSSKSRDRFCRNCAKCGHFSSRKWSVGSLVFTK